ncbi:MAG: hypothetical protein MHM6MM_001427 [Cercozoa sp. M6MM]
MSVPMRASKMHLISQIPQRGTVSSFGTSGRDGGNFCDDKNVRKKRLARYQSPGPGEYKLPPASQGRSFSLLGRRTEPSKRHDTPAPNQYSHASDQALALKKGYGVAAPFGTRTVLNDELHARSIPGPGAYDVDNSWKALDTQPKFSIAGPYPPEHKLDEVPGPGHYRPQEVDKHVGITLKSRHPEKSLQCGAEPKYNPIQTTAKPHCTRSASIRGTVRPCDDIVPEGHATPGPIYNVPRQFDTPAH